MDPAGSPAPDDRPLYVAEVTNTGGTAGQVSIHDGPPSHPRLPTGAPVAAGEGYNPEQFIAMAWATCFGETLRVVLAEQGHDPRASEPTVHSEVTATVALHRDPAGGYRFVPRLVARVDGLGESAARQMVASAHRRCPVSKLLRGAEDGEVLLATEHGDRPL